jgi:Secretory lipase
MKTKLVAFVLFIFVFQSCNKTSIEAEKNTYLVESSLIKNYSSTEFKDEISAALGMNNSTSLALFVSYGIKQYKLVYKTKDRFGQDIMASGAVIVPTGIDQPLSLGSLQHGTIFNAKEAPSYFKVGTEASIGSFLASTGMLIAMPDYVGYGASETSEHPYEHAEGLAEPSVDFLRAIKEFFKAENINWNNKLLLAGYSEGGYATMAIQKSIEENYASEFNLVASSCGAGAFNKTATIRELLTTTSIGEEQHNSSYIWVLLTYNKDPLLNREMSTYFKEPFATQIKANGYKVSISQSFDTIIKDDFKTNVLNGTDTKLLSVVKENDLYDWKPKTPTKLLHGNADRYVPFLNSKTAYDAMLKNGATQVTLKEINGSDHSTSISDFFTETFQMFVAYR